MPNKTVANLVINAPEFGMNDSFEIEDTAARATADAAASTAASTAASVQAMAVRMTAAETKNTEQDTAIANAVEAIGGKTQMYTTAGGVNTPYPQLRIGTGLEVNNGVLSASGGGGDISALTARVAALETNDGIQDTDIDNLQSAMTTAQGDISGLGTRMTTAEGDIDALEANQLTLMMQKTGLYTNSGGSNTYYTDLALGAGLGVNNGTLDVVGGGGAGYDVTGISNANSAAEGFSYPLANATNFPPAVKLGTSSSAGYPYPETLLLTTTWQTGQSAAPDGRMQVCIYKDNVYTRQRHYTSNPSAPDYPYYWTPWTTSAYSKAVAVNNANAVPLVAGLYTKGTGTLSNWPTGSGTGVLFQQLLLTEAEITSATDGNVAAVQTFTQADKIWVRTGTAVYDEIFGSYINYGSWTEIAGGGGNSLPDQTTYTTFGSGKRLYVTDTEPTGSDIPLGSVWIGGDA